MAMAWDIAWRVAFFLVGILIVRFTALSAIRTFVLPRSANDPLTRVIFRLMRYGFDARLHGTRDYLTRDRIMALYTPVSLLSLPLVWLVLVLSGYLCMFFALGVGTWEDAFTTSGSSLLTMGFAPLRTLPQIALGFSEAAIGLILVALLISYLPTMYAAFSRRETAVTMLEVRAGSPASSVEMIVRYHQLGRMEKLGQLWDDWEHWFVELDESHTSLAALAFFRSPQPNRSWVVASGAVLDAASLVASSVDIPHDAQIDLCIRSGYIALRNIADFFQFSYDHDPHFPTIPISITRAEFDEALDRLAAVGVPLKPDRDECWQHFAGWRVNYDYVLLVMARITMAPVAPWISDRPPAQGWTSLSKKRVAQVATNMAG